MNETEIVEIAEQVETVIPSEQRVAPEFYVHLVFFLIAAAVLLMSMLMKVEGANFVFLPGSSTPMPESCTAQIFLGIDCPACGLTRSFISISQGRWRNAWLFNPASFIVYLFVAVQIPWQLFQMWRIANNKRAIDGFWIYVLPLAMATTMIIQWLIRFFV